MSTSAADRVRAAREAAPRSSSGGGTEGALRPRGSRADAEDADTSGMARAAPGTAPEGTSVRAHVCNTNANVLVVHYII